MSYYYQSNLFFTKFGVLTVYFLVTLFAVALLLKGWGGPGIKMSIMLLLIMAAMFTSYIMVNDGGIFSPIPIVMLTLLVGVLSKLIYIDLNIADSYVSSFVLLGLEKEYLQRGLEVITLSIFFLMIGYFYSESRSRVTPKRILASFNTRGAIKLATVLYLIGTIALLVYIVKFGAASGGGVSGKRFLDLGVDSTSRFSSFGYYLFKLTFLVKLSFYIFLLSMYKDKVRLKGWKRSGMTILSFSTFAFSGLYFSNRLAIIMICLEALVILYFVGQRIKLRTILPFVGGTLFLVVIASELRSSGMSTKDLADHLFGGFYFFDIARNTHLIEYLSEHGALSHYDNQAGAVSKYFNLGKASGYLVYGRDYAGVPIGISMELFILGQWKAMAAGMFIIGFLMRMSTRLVTREKTRDYLIVVYAVLIIQGTILIFNNGLGAALASIGLHLVSWAMVVVFIELMFNGVLAKLLQADY